MEALLVDEPADEQDEQLVVLGELGAQIAEVLGLDRVEVGGVDAVRDRRDLALRDPEDAGDVAAHVVRAGDHAVGTARHRALDAVDVGLRVLVDPPLVAAVLGRVDRGQPRQRMGARQLLRGGRDEPVVRVDQVEYW